MWYSIKPQAEIATQALQRVREEDWLWARKSWRAGIPSAVPEWAQWDKNEWNRWIEREVDRENRENRENRVDRAAS